MLADKAYFKGLLQHLSVGTEEPLSRIKLTQPSVLKLLYT
jgi:hypothetical protein